MNTRNAARTVIINEEGLVALIEAKGGIYYKIPGGGIEDGETVEQPLTQLVEPLLLINYK